MMSRALGGRRRWWDRAGVYAMEGVAPAKEAQTHF